jgi:GTPase
MRKLRIADCGLRIGRAESKREPDLLTRIQKGEAAAIARGITIAAAGGTHGTTLLEQLSRVPRRAHRIGVTGPLGAGKSTLIGALASILRARGERVGVIACDPASQETGGAFLGDRMRMGAASGADPGLFIRSIASRGPGSDLPPAARSAAEVLDRAGFDRVILETVGAGQLDTGLRPWVDTVVVLLTPESGDEYQMMKAGLLETADVLVVNRADRPGAGGFVAALEEEVRSRAAGRPRPLVAATVATTGQGVEALLEGLDARRGSRQEGASARKGHR